MIGFMIINHEVRSLVLFSRKETPIPSEKITVTPVSQTLILRNRTNKTENPLYTRPFSDLYGLEGKVNVLLCHT